MRVLQIGGVSIPLRASLGMNQSYRSLARETIHEMGDGSAIKQTYAGTQNRIATVINGSGPIPPGLDGLDYTDTLLVRCAAERSITNSSNVIDIPAARRSDTGYEPWGRAIMMDGSVVETEVQLDGDTATLTQVTGADAYQALWFPEFYALAEGGGVQTSDEVDGASTSWQLVMRQK